MSVSLVGTPTRVGTTTSATTLTATFGTGQNNTTGDLLVAILGIGGTTFASLPAAPTGWTLQVNEVNGSGAVGIYTAAGGAAAWSATVTFGTGGAMITMYECTGQDTVNTFATTGTGTSTTSPLSVTSAAAVPTGAVALVGYNGFDSTTGSADTFTETGTGWTADGADAFGTNRCHNGFSHNASPTGGSTTTATGNMTMTLNQMTGAMIVIGPPGAGGGASTLPGAPLQLVPPAVGFPQGFIHPPQFYYQQRIGDWTIIGKSDGDLGSGTESDPSTIGILPANGETGSGLDAGESISATSSDTDSGGAADNGVAVPQAWAVQFTPRSPGLDAPQGWLQPPMPSWQQQVGDLTSTFAAGSSDAFTGTDAGESITATLSSSDTGAGTDAGESIAATLSSSDTASGTDAGESIAATQSDAESGSASDNGVAVPQAWVAPFTPRAPGLATPGQFMNPRLQSWQQLVADPSILPLVVTFVSDSDSGTGTDAGESITATLSSAETSTGTDGGESIAATQSDTEAGSASDTGVVTPQAWAVQFTPRAPGLVSPYGFMFPGMPSWQQQIGDPRTLVYSSDTGSGTDAGESIAATLSDTETGTGTEAVTSIALSSSDTSSSTDAGEQIATTDTEAGSGSDSGVAVPQVWATFIVVRPPGIQSPAAWALPRVPVPDPSLTTSSTTPFSADFGNFTDAGEQITATLSDTDTGSGAETGQIGVSSADTGTGTDAGSQIALSATDSGAGTEAVTSIALTSADSASSAEASAITVSASSTDTGSSSDAVSSLTANVPGSDTSSGADAGESITATLAAPDAGAGTDTGVAQPNLEAAPFTTRAPGLVSPQGWLLPQPSWQQIAGDPSNSGTLHVVDTDSITAADSGATQVFGANFAIVVSVIEPTDVDSAVLSPAITTVILRADGSVAD